MSTQLATKTESSVDTTVARESVSKVNLGPRSPRRRRYIAGLVVAAALAVGGTVLAVTVGGSSDTGYAASGYTLSQEEVAMISQRTAPRVVTSPAAASAPWGLSPEEMVLILDGPAGSAVSPWGLTMEEMEFATS